ncbi:MAG: class I SAM-dependent methyltransferase [Planctomycetota bacterium]
MNTMTPVNPNQQLWEKGDFTRIAASMRAAGDALVETFGIRAGMKVLDLGCGDGTTALPAAQRGADVLGVDIARNLVAAGNARAAATGLGNLRFRHGCATDLRDLADATFDLSVSIFGAMFAPRPHDVAKELVRVTRPGGRIVMGNWIPGDPTIIAQVLKICGDYLPPPPPGFVSPIRWGVEGDVTERFAAAGIPAAKISFARETFRFDAAMSPADYLAEFRDWYGPTMNAYAAAAAQGREAELHARMLELFERSNTSGAADRMTAPATFLRVTVRR